MLDCHDYIYTPSVYITKLIGGPFERLSFYYGNTENGKSLQVVSKIFHGDLEEFEKAVKEREGNDIFSQDYIDQIKKVKLLFGLENISTS